MAEGARLESVFRGNSNVGSNPTLSASILPRINTSDCHCAHCRCARGVGRADKRSIADSFKRIADAMAAKQG